MDKKQFFEELLEKIHDISLEVIIGTRIQLVRKGMYYMGICPFHNDHKIGSFIVTPSKGMWKCFTCNIGGDAIKFISLYDRLEYVEAAFNIGLEFNLINNEEYEKYFYKKTYDKKEIYKIQKKHIEKIKIEEKPKAKPTVLNTVYEIFTSCCNISSTHYIHLITERQLSPDRINRDYFTFPTKNSNFWNRFICKLNKCGYNENILRNIPGFYFDLRTKKYTFAQYKGIGIKIRNAKGEIVGLQIRKDIAKEDIRYVWFSSSFANLDENKDKYKEGTGAGAPIDVVYPNQIINPIIAITEGRFKAEKLAERGVISISIQGVTTWRNILKDIDIIKKINQYKESINRFNVYCKHKKVKNSKLPIYICFDADMIGNFSVYQQAKKMSDTLEKKYPEYKVMYLQWDEKYGKGIDDLIINNQINKVKRFKKENLDNIYNHLISNILNNCSEYENPNKIPNELIKKEFYSILHYQNIKA